VNAVRIAVAATPLGKDRQVLADTMGTGTKRRAPAS
jgi:hypothetical protein